MTHRTAAACLVLSTVLVSHGYAEDVPDSIVAEGAPAVPSDLVRALNRYQNTRAALFQGWYAGRRELLITTRFADTNQIHHVAFPGGARTQWTFLSDRVLGVAPRPNHEQLAFAADDGGAENYQLFLDDPRARTIARITDGRSRNVLSRWSNSGALLAWSSNARNGKDMDLYVMDALNHKGARRLKEVAGEWAIADWSPDERRVAAVEWISINETYVHLIDVGNGRTETLTPRSSTGAPTVAYMDVRWSKDGAALYWTTDLDSEFRRLVRYDLATKTSTVLTPNVPWNVDAYDLSDDGKTIVLAANEDGLSRLHVIDAASGAEKAGPKLPAGQVDRIEFRRNSSEFAFNLTTAKSSMDVYSFDLSTDKLVRWTESELGGIRPESLSEPTLVHYPSFDGRSIPAFVYWPGPPFKGPRPVVIEIHGGPESQFRPGFLGRANYLIDELGIALICPNVRGSAGYGKTYLKLDNGRQREDAVKDIGALLDWTAKQPDLDASRVAVMGASYGGYMSLATLTHYSDRLKAGIDIVGISNYVSFLEHTQGYRRDLRRAEYGDEREPAMRRFLESISPLAHAAKIGVPLLVVQGKNDPRVPASESEQIVAQMRKNGKPVWYVVGKNEGHGFAKKKNQDYLQAVEVLFLRRYLLDEAK